MITFTPPDFKHAFPTREDGQRAGRSVLDGVADQADQLAAEIRQAAPERSGALRQSVRVVRDGQDVVIEAGGAETMKAGKNGTVYDYALGTEYGTLKEPAQGFFYPTIRAGRADLDKAAASSLPDLKGK